MHRREEGEDINHSSDEMDDIMRAALAEFCTFLHQKITYEDIRGYSCTIVLLYITKVWQMGKIF